MIAEKRKYTDIALSEQLVLRKDFTVGSDDVEDMLDEDGKIMVSYHPNGYEYVSCYVNDMKTSNKFGLRFKVAYMVAVNLTSLNINKPFDVLFEYMDSLCQEKFDSNRFIINRDKIRQAINDTKSGKATATRRVGKYQWFKKLSTQEKRSIMCDNRKETTTVLRVAEIEKAIECLIEFNDIFITHDEIATELSNNPIYSRETYSTKTVERHINQELKSKVDEHNIRIFKTNKFKVYEKKVNIEGMIGAIEAIKLLNEKITKARVKTFSGLHINTVFNLWFEDDVQEVLNGYNETIKH